MKGGDRLGGVRESFSKMDPIYLGVKLLTLPIDDRQSSRPLIGNYYIILLILQGNDKLSFICYLQSHSLIVSRCQKKRKYSDSYLKFGFTNIVDKGVEKPQCVVCYKVLTVDSMRPSKLKLHLQTQHPSLVDKDQEYFSRLAESAKNSDSMVTVLFIPNMLLRYKHHLRYLFK